MIFKCKMCGGRLEIAEGMTVCECEYCGTHQTVPSADNEKKVNLFNRANRLRIANEFDKAAGIYESIVSEFPEESEAYWGLCLCKYGIEYVDDPATAKKIPTCHRTSYDSIFNDSNYKAALDHADPVANSLYQNEAAEIDRLQKAILVIAKNEEPYDVFICYKETDEDGQRTKDSVLAQDIYDALTAKDYKVFFARITLEDKLGQQYEPYIFSALNSAKVMLAIGTKEEYFNAVWVKNEWSRFLDLMKADRTKVLIPCYADMDAYDMPDEFKNLQAQDMGKVGFIQDLLRGIGKMLDKNRIDSSAKVVLSHSSKTNPLIKRAYIFLEEEDWDKALNTFDKALDKEPENPEAYLGLLCSKKYCKSVDELPKSIIYFNFPDNAQPNYYFKNLDKNDIQTVTYNFFWEDIEFKKALRFSNTELKHKLNDLVEKGIHNFYKIIKPENTTSIDNLCHSYAYEVLLELLEKNINVKDKSIIVKECKEILSLYDNQYKDLYLKAVGIIDNARTSEEYEKAKEIFLSSIKYKDSQQMVYNCENSIKTIEFNKKNEEITKKYDEIIKKYDDTIKEMNNARTYEEYNKIHDTFRNLSKEFDDLYLSVERLEIISISNKRELENKLELEKNIIEKRMAYSRFQDKAFNLGQKAFDEESAFLQVFKYNPKRVDSYKTAYSDIQNKKPFLHTNTKNFNNYIREINESIEEINRFEGKYGLNDERRKIKDDLITYKEAFEHLLQWYSKGKCLYCGGSFRTLFVTKCKKCGTKKDY